MQTRRWVGVAVVFMVCAAWAREDAIQGVAPREMRTWTSVSGATVDAKLVFNYGVWVMLEEPDGGRLHIRCAYLSGADKEYLRGFGATRRGFWGRVRTSAPDRIDINSCSLSQLKMLPRIGDTLARRIVEGRPYSSTKALLKIPGLGRKAYDGFRRDITAVRPKPEPESRLKRMAPEAAGGV